MLGLGRIADLVELVLRRDFLRVESMSVLSG